FGRLLTEAAEPVAGATFDTQLGVAVRRWCAPQLGLEPHTGAEAYLRRRAELGPEEVNRRLLRAAGIQAYLVDTGFGAGPSLLSPPELAEAGDGEAYEVVRLETVAERVLRDGTAPDTFVRDFAAALDAATRSAVAVKSIVAYRHGLDVVPVPPSRDEVTAAVAAVLAKPPGRLTEPA